MGSGRAIFFKTGTRPLPSLAGVVRKVADAAERARQFDAGVRAPLGLGDLIFPPIVSPTAQQATNRKEERQ